MARVLAAVAAVAIASIAAQAAAQVQYTTCDLSLGGSPVALATGDFDDNGNPDLAVVDQARNQVIILLTDPLSFQMLNCANPGTRADVAVGASPGAIAAGDLDNNLTIDLVVATQAGISILRSNASGVFTAQQPIPGGPDPQAIAIADVTGDARADIIIGNGAENQVTVLRGAASNEFDFNQRVELPTGAPISFVLAQDLNLDSEPDIAAGSSLSGQVITFLHEVGTTFRTLPALNVGVAPRAMVAVDLTRDAVPDLAVVGGGVDGMLSTYRSQLPANEVQPFVQVPPALATDRLPTSVAAGNIDGNFDPDLVVSSQDDDTAQFFFGNGSGSVVGGTVNCDGSGDCIVGAAPQSVVLADIDADGDPDVITADQGDGSIPGSLTFLLSSHPPTPVPPTPTVTPNDTATRPSTPTPTETPTVTLTPTVTSTPNPCFVVRPTTGGCDNGGDCDTCVCATDNFCCNQGWDPMCVEASTGRCANECGFTPTQTPTITETPSRTVQPTRTPTETPTLTQTPSPSGTRERTPTSTPTETHTETPTGTIPSPTRTPTETLTPSITPTETHTPTRQPTATPQCFGQGTSQICTSGDTCALTPNPEHSPGALLLLLPGLLALAVRRGR